MDNDEGNKKCYNFNRGEDGQYDVILRVDGQDFFVMRHHLGTYSDVLYGLLCKNPTNDNNDIMELEGVSAESLQIFLELINGWNRLDDSNIEGVTTLSGNWRARIPLRKCEEFLLEASNLEKSKKFILADKFGLEPLKINLLEQARTGTHIAELAPTDVTSLQRGTLELLHQRTREILTISEEEARIQAILAEQEARMRQHAQQENEILRQQLEVMRANNAAMGVHWPMPMPQMPPDIAERHGIAPPAGQPPGTHGQQQLQRRIRGRPQRLNRNAVQEARAIPHGRPHEGDQIDRE